MHKAGWAQCASQKKPLNCPRVLGKTGDFSPVMWMSFGVLDVAWVTSSLPSGLSCLRQCCPRAADSPGAALCPTDAMGCWESPQNPSPCGSTNAGKPGLCHTENLGVAGPAPFAKATPPPAQSRAGSAGHQPSRLLRLLPFPSVLPLVFHRKDSAGLSLGARLAKGGPYIGRAPTLPQLLFSTLKRKFSLDFHRGFGSDLRAPLAHNKRPQSSCDPDQPALTIPAAHSPEPRKHRQGYSLEMSFRDGLYCQPRSVSLLDTQFGRFLRKMLIQRAVFAQHRPCYPRWSLQPTASLSLPQVMLQTPLPMSTITSWDKFS